MEELNQVALKIYCIAIRPEKVYIDLLRLCCTARFGLVSTVASFQKVTIYHKATSVKIVNVEMNHLPEEQCANSADRSFLLEGGSFQHLLSSHWLLHDKWSPFEILAWIGRLEKHDLPELE
jgi:hypothetical protein